MRNKGLIKYVAGVLLVLGIVFSSGNSLRLQSESGHTTVNLLGGTMVYLKNTINYLEGENISKEVMIDDLYALSTISGILASTSSFEFLDLHETLGKNYFDNERIYADKDYRESLVKVLKKYQDALQTVFDEGQEYPESHYLYDNNILFLSNVGGKIYYDYYREKSVDRTTYKTKVEEAFFTKFNN